MEFLIEALLNLLLEESIKISSNKRISKFIRYPLIILIILFFAVIILGLLILGIVILSKNIYAGLLLIIISLIMLISGIIKFKKIYIEKNK